jgi:hypothetical protein
MRYILAANYKSFHPEDGGDMFLRKVGSYKEPHGNFTPQKTADDK